MQLPELVRAKANCKSCYGKEGFYKKTLHKMVVDDVEIAYHRIELERRIVSKALDACNNCFEGRTTSVATNPPLYELLSRLLNVEAEATEESYHPQQQPGIDY